MNAARFRKLALELPEAVEGAHQGQADFRVGGKVFATLDPEEKQGMVNLTPEQQAAMMRDEPGVFEPSTGAWGRRGYTRVMLAKASADTVRLALMAAWAKTAPRKLLKEHDDLAP